MSAFMPEQVAYLVSLPAVESVSGSRIRYARAFRDECLRRYALGEHPVALFREAGLDPKIVGYKRIERAFARWRDEAHVAAQRPAGRPAGHGTEAVGAKPDASAVSSSAGRGAEDVDSGAVSSMDGMRPAGAAAGVIDREGLGFGLSSDARPAVVAAGGVDKDADGHVEATVDEPARSGAFGGSDPRDVLILQQMHYIHYLEQQLRRFGVR